jgi:hypothetical protein
MGFNLVFKGSMSSLLEKLTVILSYIWWLHNLDDFNFITWEKEILNLQCFGLADFDLKVIVNCPGIAYF